MSRPRIAPELRQLVSERAHGKCEYCRLDQRVVALPMTIDHIIALKHGGTNDPDNLALACPNCNWHKASDLSAIDPETGQVTRLYDPRHQTWNDHFTLVGDQIVGVSPVGRATASLLRFNRPDRVLERQSLRLAGLL